MSHANSSNDCCSNEVFAVTIYTVTLPFFGSKRIPEAALMARSYLPSKVSEIVAIWRKDLNKVMFYGTFFLELL